jgi:hypothetical protein
MRSIHDLLTLSKNSFPLDGGKEDGGSTTIKHLYFILPVEGEDKRN